MVTEVTDMQELAILSSQVVQEANELENIIRGLKKIVNCAHNYDGIDVRTAGEILNNNLTTLATDIKTAAQNIESYTAGLKTLDTDDFTTQANVFSLSNIKDDFGNFITSTIPGYITTGFNNVATGVSNIVGNIGGTIIYPFTMIVNKINIVDETPNDPSAEESSREIPLYDQTNYDDVKYGSGTIATSGCGITSLAMLATYYTGEEWTPDKCAALVEQSGIIPKDNADRMLIAADKIGLSYEQKTTKDIMPSLEEGKTVIALVNNSGHFVVLRGLTEDGKVLVNDPYGPWQDAKDAEGQNLKFNENGYIVQNDINLSAGRIWVFDGMSSEKS